MLVKKTRIKIRGVFKSIIRFGSGFVVSGSPLIDSLGSPIIDSTGSPILTKD